MDTIEIPFSKSKALLSIGGSVLFVMLGYYLITMLAYEQQRVHPMVAKGVGIAAIFFFGATAVYGIKKFFDKKVGLTIDAEGITDHSNATSVGLIGWEEITAIETAQVMSTKFLLIKVKDPQSLLERASGLKRRLMASNLKMYGTPVSITSTTLDYNFRQLEFLLRERLHAERAKRPALQ